MGIMSLAVAKGTVVTLRAEGHDEEKALDALQVLIEKED